jgi:hypothetical protein
MILSGILHKYTHVYVYVILKTDTERVITMTALKDQYDLEIALFEFGIAPPPTHTHTVEFQQKKTCVYILCVHMCVCGGGAWRGTPQTWMD